ncbi:hypothetical protein Patl1_14531 [Pistacia atlantica]|uniref:Uncharacterized protein n=1 Tax=Pistacia atlantica TaxID=434234 RepID=A0ACC1AUT8_9ROSI|nr:hypothetical protein Patl1_14531 [Pistacia atlantica]
MKPEWLRVVRKSLGIGQIHSKLCTKIQLIEFLVSDYLTTWISSECFDNMLFEEWVKSVLQARKATQLWKAEMGFKFSTWIESPDCWLNKLVKLHCFAHSAPMFLISYFFDFGLSISISFH